MQHSDRAGVQRQPGQKIARAVQRIQHPHEVWRRLLVRRIPPRSVILFAQDAVIREARYDGVLQVALAFVIGVGNRIALFIVLVLHLQRALKVSPQNAPRMPRNIYGVRLDSAQHSVGVRFAAIRRRIPAAAKARRPLEPIQQSAYQQNARPRYA